MKVSIEQGTDAQGKRLTKEVETTVSIQGRECDAMAALPFLVEDWLELKERHGVDVLRLQGEIDLEAMSFIVLALWSKLYPSVTVEEVDKVSLDRLSEFVALVVQGERLVAGGEPVDQGSIVSIDGQPYDVSVALPFSVGDWKRIKAQYKVDVLKLQGNIDLYVMCNVTLSLLAKVTPAAKLRDVKALTLGRMSALVGLIMKGGDQRLDSPISTPSTS